MMILETIIQGYIHGENNIIFSPHVYVSGPLLIFKCFDFWSFSTFFLW